MPEHLPEDMPEHLPEDMPGRMPEDMPDRMPDRMPENMSDRMPEALPVTKCINVMVGITRSKVIFNTKQSWQSTSKCIIQFLGCQLQCRGILGKGRPQRGHSDKAANVSADPA
jgi:hypothetical protein